MSSNSEENTSKVDPGTAWLEQETIGGFRIWHIIAFCLGILLGLIVMVCCCIRFRIPRTKQEIEADYQRKKITKRFREKLQEIKNSEMDDMDLQKVIARIQADYLAGQNGMENLCNEQQQQQQQQQIKFKHNIQPPV